MLNPVTHIRRAIFHCDTQDAFANLIGVSQVTVSRWEKWGRIPGHRQELVRKAAIDRDLAWDDRWFFQAPAEEATA